jgi:hypothetical protein
MAHDLNVRKKKFEHLSVILVFLTPTAVFQTPEGSLIPQVFIVVRKCVGEHQPSTYQMNIVSKVRLDSQIFL